ncbi:MAG: hypothetical protein ACR2QU_10455, partial [Gammaproteobacteria bacterium]
MSLFTELKRRNVFRVATAYVVVGWLLTEISTTLLPTFGAPDWVVKALLFLFALGFIPVLVFSWAFELTPEGIKLEKDVDRSASITSETGKKLNYVTIGAVLVGLAFLIWDKTDNSASTQTADEVVATTGAPSVAVLPFVNMSGNADNEYFSDGLTETLLHMLAQIPELRVAARTSSFAFKGEEKDIREIANALDVAHILEGSVQRSGDRVRITAQLIRANDGFHVWSENFDRTLDDIFAIQDEIAGRVGSSLSASLLGSKEAAPVVSVGTENLAAYDFYLQALADKQKGSYGSLQAAEGHLKDALARDPGFDDAKTELASVYMDQWMTGLIEGDAVFAEAISLGEQVLEGRPDDVRATTALLRVEIFRALFANNIQEAQDIVGLLDEHARKNPNDVDAVKEAASVLALVDQRERALGLLAELVELDPLNPGVHYELGTVLLTEERWAEARAAALRSLELEPNQPNSNTLIARTYRDEGDRLGWLRYYLKAIEIDAKDHELPGEVAEVLYRLGLLEEAGEFRARVMAIAPSSPAAYLLKILKADSLGDTVAARAAARKAIEDDIVNRQDTYRGAIQFLVEDALLNGNESETLAYLESTVPGIADFDDPVT